jgi:arylsulfatase A-like enzyme
MEAEAKAPNIIFIFTDDLGWGDLGVLHQNAKAGDKKISTPLLDSMASEGVVLNRHYCPAPVCSPSRSSLLEGQHQGHASVRDTLHDSAMSDNHTLGTVLQEAGYYTAMIGKYGLPGTSGNSPATWPAYPTDRGFDYFYGYVGHADAHQHYPDNTWSLGNSATHRNPKKLYENDAEVSDGLNNCYTTDLFAARAKQMIIDETTNNPERPFFIFLSHDTPHAALQLPTMAYPTGKGLSGGLQWLGTYDHMINTAPPTATIDSYINPLYSGKGWPNTHERFATMVTRIDHTVGDLLQTLKDLEIDDETIVVFSSDNGPHEESYIKSNGAYDPRAFESYGPFEGIKRDVYEGGLRVPTLAWGPTRLQAGLVTQLPSQLHDWMATFCDVAGVPVPAVSDGVSLLPTLSGVGVQKENLVYTEFLHSKSLPNWSVFPNHRGTLRGQSQVIYMDGYKGIRVGISAHSDDFEIYDTLTDLPEANNLAASSSYFMDLEQRMKDKVLRVRRADSRAPRPYDDELIPAVTVANVPGLEVHAYEGSWSWMPEFEDLATVSTDTVTNVNVSHLSRATDAGLYYTGYVNIPASGEWTFYTQSDAGTVLRIHESLVIDDDFEHTGAEVSGALMLEAGWHPIRLYYRSEVAAPSLSLQWSGPETAKAPVPDQAFVSDTVPVPLVANDDSALTLGSSAVLIPVLQNDTDDGLPLALSIDSVGTPGFGSVQISGNQVEYQADAGKYGEDVFSYVVTDGESSASAEVRVNVVVDSDDLWFPLNETMGAEVEEAGGRYTGAHQGIADSAAAHIPAKFGYGLTFDGSNDVVAFDGLPLPEGASARTLSAWVRVSAQSGVEAQGFLSYGTDTSGGRINLRLDTSSASNQRLRLEVGNGYIRGTTQINDGEWHHVAAVIDDFDTSGSVNVDEVKLYVDGVLETVDGSTSRVINTAVNTTFYLGGSGHSSSFNFKGDLDEVRIWKRAFSAAEVLAEFNAEKQEQEAWAYRHFGNAAPTWTSDSDQDSHTLLEEYALGGDPHVADAVTSLMEAVYNPASDRLEVAFTRRKDGTHGLSYTAQFSDDLVDWTLPFTIQSVTAHPELDPSEFDQVTAEGESAEGRVFMRMMIE